MLADAQWLEANGRKRHGRKRNVAKTETESSHGRDSSGPFFQLVAFNTAIKFACSHKNCCMIDGKQP